MIWGTQRFGLTLASNHLLCCWSAHKSLAPRARTLLGVLGHATLNFVAVATLLFCFFCECPKFFDLAKQRRKMFLGVSEVGKIDFALYFCWLCVFFVIFYILLLRSRDIDRWKGGGWAKNHAEKVILCDVEGCDLLGGSMLLECTVICCTELFYKRSEAPRAQKRGALATPD